MIESVWIYLAPMVVLAGLVRGYIGFGFAAIAVVGMNLFLTPQQSVPVVLGLDLLCSAPLLTQALKQADIPTFKLLTLGSVIGIPLGLGLLLLVPSEQLKLGICVLILVISLLLALDVRFKGTDTLAGKLSFGILAGAGTSGSSVGGPIIVSYMLSSSLTSATQRATMILFFVVSEIVALGALFSSGLIGWDIVKLTMILLIPTLIAVRIGQWLFNKRQPHSFKPTALPIMVMVALLGISSAVGH